jgi:hypothetical protein
MLSGIRDVDREILSKLDDKNLLIACSTDKYTWNTVCDNDFLKRRLLAKYPQIEREKLINEKWKAFFLRATHYIALLKEKYNFDYTFGNFAKQYKILKRYNMKDEINDWILFDAVAERELALVIWFLNNLNSRFDDAFIILRKYKELKNLENLVEMGANMNAYNDKALKILQKYFPKMIKKNK